MVKTPGTGVKEAPLSPVDRSALLMLNWWKRSVKHGVVPISGGVDPRSFKIRTNHFILALAALHDLNPTDPLYLPRAANASAPFSLTPMLTTMLHVLKYLKRAYNSTKMVTDVDVPGLRGTTVHARKYIFPLVSSCLSFEFVDEND
jgi:hypothetical protein